MGLVVFKVWRLRRWYLALGLLAVLVTGGYITWRQQAAQQALAVIPVLRDRVIVVDAGHGGIDPGAVGKNGTLEKDITLEVAKKLGLVLCQAGAQVILTRDRDTDLSDFDLRGPSKKKHQDLRRRVEVANERGAEVFISIHVNSFPSAKSSGAQTFYQKGQEQGRVLAESIQNELKRVLQNTNRGAKGIDIFTSRETKMPAVTVEMGFISNPREERLMIDSDYQSKVVWGIFVGIVDYFSQGQAPR